MMAIAIGCRWGRGRTVSAEWCRRHGGRSDRHEALRWPPRRPSSGGFGAGQRAHQQRQVEAGDVDQVALGDVVAPAQPGSSHAAAVEDVSEGAFAQFGAELEGGPGDAAEQAGAVVVDRTPSPVALAEECFREYFRNLGSFVLRGVPVRSSGPRRCSSGACRAGSKLARNLASTSASTASANKRRTPDRSTCVGGSSTEIRSG